MPIAISIRNQLFPISGLSIAAAAAASSVPAASLAAPGRSLARIARARQLAVYLHHVGLGASLSACARQFRRDRATVRHACAVIEHLRDDRRFDQAAARLESAVRAQRDMVLALLADFEGAAQ
ncbi:chromosomal replication initiator DnaA [Methylocystis sp. MJC1]|jgi:hypothetical protein|uniref:helix-turn-helix domain-containing protein n=1 Tax=Methylocystis sp. MJC1 TaxID=2654282 RepID=UPI0013EDB1E9|nr:helix-turn-helix domain-containing protein [Methylocystis sp. MJC1]KAF2989792.1 Chromosomal replication initiator protein DnaA [Methylocystis sp. MJC1]MBU6526320.1 chromosomal replication initiator DnaA [Methylocystis sp. MJC1]UZX12773.1 chromosomal replication initiator DnaA [Methylocystis sp. MJC1]